MNNVRIGIIGFGGMGASHGRYIAGGMVEGATLTAVCDQSVERLQWTKETFGDDIHTFTDMDEMLDSGLIDAVMITTPHYDHPPSAIKCFEKGLHVLIEKPAGVYTNQVIEMNEVAKKSGKVFSIMYNLRNVPIYAKLRELIVNGELGEIRRTNWIVTDWYRTQSYYDGGDWRGTWEGEGGGVLINQVPHQLDLWQWTVGMMPKRLRAFCHFGKHRDIEVENEVTAYVEYENGATGVFITSTCEAPGTNRYEVIGDRGKVVIENGELKFSRLTVSETEFNATSADRMKKPEVWNVDVPIPEGSGEHRRLTQNFVDAIREGTPLLAPGEEGIHGLTLSNAMLLSTWTDSWVELPLDHELFEQHLNEQIKKSKNS